MAKEPKQAPGANPGSSPGQAPDAEQASPKQKVRYQVLAPVFVNGSLVDPKGRQDVYVHAQPGLEGRALKLAPEETAPASDAAGDPGSTAGTSGGSAPG
jgi:hypothetical protein